MKIGNKFLRSYALEFWKQFIRNIKREGRSLLSWVGIVPLLAAFPALEDVRRTVGVFDVVRLDLAIDSLNVRSRLAQVGESALLSVESHAIDSNCHSSNPFGRFRKPFAFCLIDSLMLWVLGVNNFFELSEIFSMHLLFSIFLIVFKFPM